MDKKGDDSKEDAKKSSRSRRERKEEPATKIESPKAADKSDVNEAGKPRRKRVEEQGWINLDSGKSRVVEEIETEPEPIITT